MEHACLNNKPKPFSAIISFIVKVKTSKDHLVEFSRRVKKCRVCS